MADIAKERLRRFLARISKPNVSSLAPGITITQNFRNRLQADVYQIGWNKGDCAYHGVVVSPEGKVYFSVSSHIVQQPAQIFEFDPSTSNIRKLCSITQFQKTAFSVVQGKIHTPLAVMGDELIACTHTSWYNSDHVDPATGLSQTLYPGGCIFAVNIKTGQARLVAGPLGGQSCVTAIVGKKKVPMGGDGIIASVFDSARCRIYVSTWPTAKFMKLDITSGKLYAYGALQEDAETVPRTEISYQRALRTLGLDNKGHVYGSTGQGRVWKYDAELDRILFMNSRMEQATPIKMPSKVPWLNMWRTIVWEPYEEVFYGIHWSTSWLFRFDPNKDSLRPIAPWRAYHLITAEKNPDYAQLGLALGPGRVLYGLVHAPALKKGAKRSVHLLTYDISRKTLHDHGPIYEEKGKALMFTQSCAVTDNGDVYTVGWMEAEKESFDELLKLRENGPSETRSFAYVMALVRIAYQNIHYPRRQEASIRPNSGGLKRRRPDPSSLPLPRGQADALSERP